MLAAALILGGLLAVAAVWFVARPFLTGKAADDLIAQPDGERLVLEEERDRALAALKELEFDHRTGKVSDEDYRRQVGDLRRSAADALRAIDREQGLAMTRQRTEAVEAPPSVPEPEPIPHEPPGPVIVPEPEPVPHEPPGPVIVPEPSPEPEPEPRAR